MPESKQTEEKIRTIVGRIRNMARTIGDRNRALRRVGRITGEEFAKTQQTARALNYRADAINIDYGVSLLESIQPHIDVLDKTTAELDEKREELNKILEIAEIAAKILAAFGAIGGAIASPGGSTVSSAVEAVSEAVSSIEDAIEKEEDHTEDTDDVDTEPA